MAHGGLLLGAGFGTGDSGFENQAPMMPRRRGNRESPSSAHKCAAMQQARPSRRGRPWSKRRDSASKMRRPNSLAFLQILNRRSRLPIST
ncbi:hypothetical protein LG3211_5129 [Lysobacter gummosus]|nr:hypothetical protein LG3211_5129 [Lysobacter gummosus]